MLDPLIMVASNNNVVVTKVRSVNNNDTIRNRSNSPHTNKSARKVLITAAAMTTGGVNQIEQDTEFHDSVSSSAAIAALPHIPKYNNSNIKKNNSNNSNNHLRRVRSDNLAQSKRNDPNCRRSIFGQYFQEKPRSFSSNHLVRGQGQQQQQLPPPPIPPQHPLPHQQQQQQQQQQIPKLNYLRRSSSSSASSSGSTTSGGFRNPQQDDNSNDNNNHSYRHFDHRPVDYRVFAPSREQSATSAICNRFQELNKEHEHDYESLLERQITEHSLPPFPSPLRRFCSETTTAIMAGTGAAAVTVGDTSCFLPSSRSRSSSSYDSSGDMHHYCGGVYSLLTPVSILRPPKYSSSSNKNNNNNNNESTDSTSDENFTEQNETGEHQQLPPPSSVSSSFNVPRSFQGPSTTILKNFVEATASAAASVSAIEEEKESDNLTTIISATTTTTTTPSNYKGLREEFCDVVDSEEKMEQEEEEQRCELQQVPQQRIRFDPRVTVTEFEDSVRKWYEEEELEQLKREAITLAQSYLRQHPAVAKWYQTAKLDLVTKSYRKKALYSLPVFSSSYSNNAVEEELSPNITKTDNIQSVSSSLSPSSQQVDELNPFSVKKILIVEPHPAIASLFCKSMKSMFPSAELTAASSGEQASQMIKQSFIPNNNKNRSTSTTTGVDTDTTTTSYDIIIVEQSLTPKATTSQSNNDGNSNKPNIFQGLIDIFCNKNTNHEESKAASVSCEIHYGSELIELISKLMAQQQQDHNNDRSSSCLIIGVSFQPDCVAEKMIRSGADFVWGKPIPNVGDTLRDNILSKLLAKRNPSGNYTKYVIRPATTPNN